MKKKNKYFINLFPDFVKAFDNLEWNFVDYYMNILKFSESLREWLRISYTFVEICILNNVRTFPVI